MKASRIIGLTLVLIGILMMVYGGFNYRKKVNDVQIGSVELSVSKNQFVYIPFWVGIVSIAAGAGMFVLIRKDKAA